MANRRFIDFPIASSVGDNDIVLIWQDGMNKQTTKGTLIQGAPTSLEGLTDVDIAGLINGQILQYNSTTGKWENVDRTDINLSQLGDVSIVSPSNGQVLVYNSSTSKWENSSGGYVPYTGAVTTVDLGAQTIQAGSFVKVGGTSAQFLKADGSVDSSTYLTTGSAAATYVPYTGATADVNLGAFDLLAERGTFENNGSSNTLTVNHTSGSGYGIIVTKGGNNEALYVSKTSGSGNAMTVVGGRTSLVDLALSSVSNTAGDFLTLSGGVVHKRTAAETLTDIGGQAALTNPVTGTGVSGRVSFWNGANTQGGSNNFNWDNSTSSLRIGTTSQIGASSVTISRNNAIALALNIDSTESNDFSAISWNGSTASLGGLNSQSAAIVGYRVGAGAVGRLGFWTRLGTTNSERWTIESSGILQSNGAQTIQTSTGALTIQPTGGVNLATSSGNVGIGINAPTARLHVRNLVSNSEYAIFSTSSDANRDLSFSSFAVSSSNSVGHLINALSSAGALAFGVNGERWRITSTGILQSNGAQTIQTSTGNLTLTSADNTGIVDIRRTDRALGAELRITNSFNGSGWLAGDIVGTLNFVSTDGSTTEPIRSQIKAINTGVSNTYASEMNLTFSTASFNTLTEGFRLTNLSNVLIGITTDAGFRLDVNGTARVQTTLKVGAATATNASSVLDLESTTRGFLPPRMTSTQRNAIASPATGLVVYDTTLNKLAVYTGAAWETVTSL